MLSSAMIAAIQMPTRDDSFLDTIITAGKEDDTWMARKEELRQLKETQETLSKHWELEDGLLYYRNRLFIPSMEVLVTEIAKGCQDSNVAGYFGQEETIELVTRDFHWKNTPNGSTTMSCLVMNSKITNVQVTLSMDPPTHSGTLHGMDIYLSGFHYPVTRVRGTNPDHGSSGSMYTMAHCVGLATSATTKEVADTFLKEI